MHRIYTFATLQLCPACRRRRSTVMEKGGGGLSANPAAERKIKKMCDATDALPSICQTGISIGS